MSGDGRVRGNYSITTLSLISPRTYQLEEPYGSLCLQGKVAPLKEIFFTRANCFGVVPMLDSLETKCKPSPKRKLFCLCTIPKTHCWKQGIPKRPSAGLKQVIQEREKLFPCINFSMLHEQKVTNKPPLWHNGIPSFTRKSSLCALPCHWLRRNNRGTVGCPCHPAGLWLTRAITEEMRGLWIKSNPASSYSQLQTILILSDGEESLQMSSSLASWENFACRSSFSHTIKLMPFLV